MPDSSRREFITGRSLQNEIVHAADEAGRALLDGVELGLPQSTRMVAISTKAMACDFHVFLNSGPNSSVEAWFASDAMDLIHSLEDQMTVYRDHGELVEINRVAFEVPVTVEARLFELLKQTVEIARATGGAFDPTMLPLVQLWRRCRDQRTIPQQVEIDEALKRCGIDGVQLDLSERTVRFLSEGLTLNLNGIGKGYALDRAAEIMAEHEISNFMFQGGASSVLAQGEHNELGGWPVGIRNPLFPNERLATVLLRDRAMGTSGSGVQFFRHQGKRFGHILDPRTGWPVDHHGPTVLAAPNNISGKNPTTMADSANNPDNKLLSVTVFAPTAAEADALSTAFFVMGLEKVRAFCQNRTDVSALLILAPRTGRMLEIVNVGFPDEDLFLEQSKTN